MTLTTIQTTIITLAKTGLVFCVYFLVRNELTYRVRTRILREHGYDTHQKLPSYRDMVYSFKPISYGYWTKKIGETKYNKPNKTKRMTTETLLPILTTGEKNENGRIYTQETVDNIVEQFEQKRRNQPVLGELIHSPRYQLSPTVSLANVSHEVTDLVQRDNALYGAIEILDTETGKAVKQHTGPMSLKFRGLGMVNEDWTVSEAELITFDLCLERD